MTRRANYVILEDDPHASDDTVVIRDEGPWDEFLTVTNAAEIVVDELFTGGRLREGQRLLYYDSDGQLDELQHTRGVFRGFAPGPR